MPDRIVLGTCHHDCPDSCGWVATVTDGVATSLRGFVQPLPGTDAALALAMMHVIIRDGHVDTEYVQRHTSGFDALREHVATWTPARAAAICGLGPSEIERLATAFATTRPAAIRTLIGPEHREHGAMAFRTISCLPLLTGAWRDRGGGYARATGSWFSDVIDETGLYGASLGDTGVANSLTNDALTDRGGGAAFHDTLVEVTAISRERPARPTTPAG